MFTLFVERMQEVTLRISLVLLGALVSPLAVEGGNVLHTPVWFTRLMAERNCTFTHMLYANDQCELVSIKYYQWGGSVDLSDLKRHLGDVPRLSN